MWMIVSGKALTQIGQELGLSPNTDQHLPRADPAQDGDEEQRRVAALRDPASPGELIRP
jgi:phage terminase small subunit